MSLNLYNLAAEYQHDLEKLQDLDLPEEVLQDTLGSVVTRFNP